MTANLRINIDRLWASIMESAAIGATPKGGLRRLALSAEDGEMRRLFMRWCAEAGMDMRIDALGNMFATRAGRNPHAKAIMLASHLDTQIFGGKFDGVVGVLGALEIVRTLNDHGIETKHPLIVGNWTNEEGARFEPAMIGSKAFAGFHDVGDVLDIRDGGGIRFGDALREIGFAGTDVLGPDDLDSYFELHIEQGAELEEQGVKVGVVTGAFDIRFMVVEVTGESAHGGATRMRDRRNAMVGAAEIVTTVHEIGMAYAGTGARSACGRLTIEPNLLGAVPHRAEVLCDFRHGEPRVTQQMVDAFKARLPGIEAKSRCTLSIVREWTYGGEPYDATLAGLVRDSARDLGHTSMDMLTVAGHDSMNIARRVPSVMIFTPCEKGITHNEAETVTPGDIEPGVNVLLHAVLKRDRARTGEI